MTSRGRRRSPGWGDYVARFHRDHAAVTEDLLGPSRDRTGRSPYDWLLAAHPGGSGVTLDVGCGSAPTAGGAERWVGVDRSADELRAGRRRTRATVVRGDAVLLPVGDAAVETIVLSMSLMVFEEPEAALAEAARVVVPGGTLLVLVPAWSPAAWRDRLRMGSLMAAVGTLGFPFPRRDVLTGVGDLVRAAGFDVVSDDRRGFRVPLDGPEGGADFVDALYLRGVAEWRIGLARSLARRWRGPVSVPLRRVVARRPGGARRPSVSCRA